MRCLVKLFVSACMGISLLSIINTAYSYPEHRDDPHLKLIFAADIIRHGDRTPSTYLDTDKITYPISWNDIGPDELTGQGLSKLLQLGGKFKEIYIDKYYLLPEQYDKDKIFVRSTGFDRTMISSLAVLLGLYPIDALQQPEIIHIDVVPRSQDNLLAPNDAQPQKFGELVEQYVFSTPEWQDRLATEAENLARWSRDIEYDLSDVDSFIAFADNVFSIQVYCNQDIDCITSFIPLSDEDIEQVLALADWGQAQVFMPPQIGMFMGCNLISEISSNMSKLVEGRESILYTLYAGHDSTLLGAMSYLNDPLDHQPSFNADLSVKLFQTLGRDSYVVRVSYHDDTTDHVVYQGTLEEFKDQFFNQCSFEKISVI